VARKEIDVSFRHSLFVHDFLLKTSGQEGISDRPREEIVMGSSKRTGSKAATAHKCQAEAMISVETSQLKEKLNRMFTEMHGSKADRSHDSVFDRLWDLKEMAILEGKKTVDLPSQWLSELDAADVHSRKH
jgi:hypothetical protein